MLIIIIDRLGFGYTSVLIYYIWCVYSLVRIRNSRREDMCWSARYWLDISTRKEARCWFIRFVWYGGIDMHDWSILRWLHNVFYKLQVECSFRCFVSSVFSRWYKGRELCMCILDIFYIYLQIWYFTMLYWINELIDLYI